MVRAYVIVAAAVSLVVKLAAVATLVMGGHYVDVVVFTAIRYILFYKTDVSRHPDKIMVLLCISCMTDLMVVLLPQMPPYYLSNAITAIALNLLRKETDLKKARHIVFVLNLYSLTHSASVYMLCMGILYNVMSIVMTIHMSDRLDVPEGILPVHFEAARAGMAVAFMLYPYEFFPLMVFSLPYVWIAYMRWDRIENAFMNDSHKSDPGKENDHPLLCMVQDMYDRRIGKWTVGGRDSHRETFERFKIMYVDTVDNDALLRRFDNESAEIARKNGRARRTLKVDVQSYDEQLWRQFGVRKESNELLLFHGIPTREALDAILLDGLDPRLSGRNAGSLFGRGTYLTDHPAKADQYCRQSVGNVKGVYAMLVCRVSMGKTFTIRGAKSKYQGMMRPPCTGGCSDPHKACTHDRHDSVTVDAPHLRYKEYVVFDSNRAVPVMVIHYKRQKIKDMPEALVARYKKNQKTGGCIIS